MLLSQKMFKRRPGFKVEYLYILGWGVLNILKIDFVTCNLLLALGFIAVISLMRKSLNFQPGLLMLIFISFYLIYLIPVFTFNIPIAYHTQYNTLQYYHKTLSIFILFLIFLTIFLKRMPNQIVLKNKLPVIKSSALFYVLLAIQVVIIIQAVSSGASIAGSSNSYEVYVNNLENSNGLWEYFYLVYFLAYLFAPNKYCKRHILLTIFLIYCYVSLTRGYRIQLIEMIFLVFILYVDGNFKNIFIVAGTLLGLVSMELFGLYKIAGKLDFDYFIHNFQNYDTVLVSNQTEVFYSTTAVLALKSSGYLGWAVQSQTFFAFVLNFIIPTGLLWKGSRVLDYLYISDIGGGGFCFGYFYFWFGIAGVIAIAYFVGWNLNNRASTNIYKIIYLILFIALCPRWFAYEPTNHLVRLPLMIVIAYFGIVMIFEKKVKTNEKRFIH
jgi:hypothetical protein